MECFACRNSITDQSVVKVGDSLHLHEACLHCSACQQKLDATCFAKNGAVYCKADYIKLFWPRCGRCTQTFEVNSEEVVQCVGEVVYHLECFSCAKCEVKLEKGMKMGRDDWNNLLCEQDYLSWLDAVNKNDDNKEENVSQEDDMSDKENDPKEDGDDDADADLDDDKKECKDGKRRGPRTNISAKQLEILKNCFVQTPKPTRLMREQLAKDTALSMRVIQVWFQNKRSKEKRMHQLRYMNGGYGRGGPIAHPMFMMAGGAPIPPQYGGNHYAQMHPAFAFPPATGHQFCEQPSTQVTAEFYGESVNNGFQHAYPSPPHQQTDFASPAGISAPAGAMEASTPKAENTNGSSCFPSPPLSVGQTPPPESLPQEGMAF